MARTSAGTKTKKTEVESLKHKDKRVNIPTEELRDFVADEEKSPKTVLYPRDPSLDPQLVWKGKDEQDAEPLAVPAVPIYIQEKIHPQALIEDLRQSATAGGNNEPQIEMFAEFNGLPREFDKRVDFYHWPQNWSNRMILGDSLMVMNSLTEKEGLKGKVQMIYIDPPYGIKFGSNWQVSTRKRDVKDGRAEDVNREPEVVKAFRDTWEYGIHSYLGYLRDRLVAAHTLLSESGSVFVQIGDKNVHLVRSILDEVFGAENFVSIITFLKTSGAGSPAIGTKVLASTADFIVWYGKSVAQLKYRQLYRQKEFGEEGASQYIWVQSPDGDLVRAMTDPEKQEPTAVQSGWRILAHDNLTSQTGAETTQMEVAYRGQTFRPTKGGWKTNAAGMSRVHDANRLMALGDTLRYRRQFEDFPYFPYHNVWTDLRTSGFADPKVYVVQTNPSVIERCVLMTTDPGDLVLDSTCGSGTTAYVAEQWGRRWITCDTSRVALALARTRLMSSRYSYYLLADSTEGAQKEAEISGSLPSNSMFQGDVKRGFIYKRAPHITLKSIANNEEIDAIHAKWQDKLEPVRKQLNSLLKQKWEEWQVPREADEKWPAKAKTVLAEWWELRRQRQQEIDASIAAHADTELLYDQPYEDPKRIRVSGPFTVESLSPHRVITAGEDQGETQAAPSDAKTSGSFVQTILENLKKAGVQNTVKKERLTFDRLEPYSGVYIQAAGEYTESPHDAQQRRVAGTPSESGKTKRVAVCIGPEYGTVGPDLMKEAAKEAVQGVGYDLLIVCGFAFDPYISEEAMRYGKLTVLTARMNPDLAMGDELLKKTGAGNLFMVFGEPDIEIKKQKDGNLVVTIKGVDVYDPTTGQIRTSSTDDIACWFIDTNYNGESFFVRHAYFTGADEPYEKLKKALRAEVDEAAWSSLYSTVSRPFPPPKPQGKRQPKIAVKVINHYGDEVMKVYAL